MVQLHIYIAPLQNISSIPNATKNDYIASVSETTHSELKESPVADTRISAEPTDSILLTAEHSNVSCRLGLMPQ